MREVEVTRAQPSGRTVMVPLAQFVADRTKVSPMTRTEAAARARAHVGNCLRTSLDVGWPSPAEHGYTEEEAALVASEIRRIADRIDPQGPA